MIPPLPSVLAYSRESTPTPSEQPSRRWPKDLPNNLAATQDFYDPHLPNSSRNSHSATSDATLQDLESLDSSSWLSPGDASVEKYPRLNMPDSRQHPSSSDSGRSSGTSSRGRSRSQSQSQSNIARRFPGRSSNFLPQFSPSAQDLPPSPSTSQRQSFPSIPHYQSPHSYGPTSGYSGPYTVSNQPQMRMVSGPYGYVHPQGYNTQDVSQSDHIGYSPSSMVSMMQPHLYQYPGHSTDGNTSAPAHSFSGASPNIYSHMNSTPSLHSPSSHGHSSAPRTGPYGPSTFGAMQFPMTPQFPFQGQSYPSPNIYQSTYVQPSYQYGTDQDNQGAWWYFTPGHSSPFENMQRQYHQSHYPLSFQPMTNESYSQAGPSVYPQPQQQPQLPIAQPSDTQNQISPSQPLPPPLQSATGGTKSEPGTLPPSPKERSGPVRRSYHPNPPQQRSEWVMWAGNVPSDATRDELWRFFNNLPDGASVSDEVNAWISSIFLISRSNCAFVNFDTEEHLHAAIIRFSGKQIRPDDPKCPHLVCRVRRKDDDLKAGVGGQRGVGLHVKWVQEKAKAATTTPDGDLNRRSSSSSPGDVGRAFASMSISSDEEGHPLNASAYSNSPGSRASTNSSLLTKYFPKRYFILKSLTQFDLDLSVEKGLWATQRHNEGILDQAYRTSTDVYLIFGVNKSGEFYGYARMAGPISRNEAKVPWASRNNSPSSSRSSLSLLASRDSPTSTRQGFTMFSPSDKRYVEKSPLPMFSDGITNSFTFKSRGTSSAPAELHQIHHKFSFSTPGPQTSSDNLGSIKRDLVQHEFELDPNAPIRALRHPPQDISSEGMGSGSIVESPLESVPEERTVTEPDEDEGDGRENEGKGDGGKGDDESWGEPFKIEWIHTNRLPFYRTRHLRNPWNHDREIKVSRDGTELEPSVGQSLLEEWDRPDPSPSSPTSSRPLGSSKREHKNQAAASSMLNRNKREKEGDGG